MWGVGGGGGGGGGDRGGGGGGVPTLEETMVHNKVHMSVHSCTTNYSRFTKCGVHDHICKHVIRCKKKRVPRFLILEALNCSFFKKTFKI